MADTAVDISNIPAPFDAIAGSYDDTFTNSLIGQAQRNCISRELNRAFVSGRRILEINCGTGIDALNLVNRGVQVVACDSAPRMIAVARQRLLESPEAVRSRIRFEVLATEDIGRLASDDSSPEFDGAFSNFAGLNCVDDLSLVARDLARILKSGAPLLVCCFGRICAWEIFWYLARGNPRKAFRRLHPGGSLATIAPGTTVRVRYPGLAALAHAFAPHFRLVRWKGVGIAVPPTYAETLGRRFPRVFRVLTLVEPWLESCPLIRRFADHVLLEFRRNPHDYDRAL